MTKFSLLRWIGAEFVPCIITDSPCMCECALSPQTKIFKNNNLKVHSRSQEVVFIAWFWCWIYIITLSQWHGNDSMIIMCMQHLTVIMAGITFIMVLGPPYVTICRDKDTASLLPTIINSKQISQPYRQTVWYVNKAGGRFY